MPIIHTPTWSITFSLQRNIQLLCVRKDDIGANNQLADPEMVRNSPPTTLLIKAMFSPGAWPTVSGYWAGMFPVQLLSAAIVGPMLYLLLLQRFLRQAVGRVHTTYPSAILPSLACCGNAEAGVRTLRTLCGGTLLRTTEHEDHQAAVVGGRLSGESDRANGAAQDDDV